MIERPSLTSRLRDDEGIGLVEIVVALLLLAILAISFLPVLVQGLRSAADNATRATAYQLAQQQVEAAQAKDADCSDIQAVADEPIANFVDPREVTLATDATAGSCPGSYPGTVQYTVTVIRTDTGEVLTAANTLLYVENG